MNLKKKTPRQWVSLVTAVLAAIWLFFVWRATWQEGPVTITIVAVSAVGGLATGFYLLSKRR